MIINAFERQQEIKDLYYYDDAYTIHTIYIKDIYGHEGQYEEQPEGQIFRD